MRTLTFDSASDLQGARTVINRYLISQKEWYSERIDGFKLIYENVPDEVFDQAMQDPDWSDLKTVGTQIEFENLLAYSRENWDNGNKEEIKTTVVYKMVVGLTSVAGKENINSILNSLP